MRYTCIKKKYPRFSKDCVNCSEYNPCVKDGKYCFVGAMENERMISDAVAPLTEPAAMPALAKHDYRDVKIANGTTVTIDLEEIKENMRKQINGDAFDIFRSAT